MPRLPLLLVPLSGHEPATVQESVIALTCHGLKCFIPARSRTMKRRDDEAVAFHLDLDLVLETAWSRSGFGIRIP